MRPDLEKRIAALAADRQSGASELLSEAIDVLRAAQASRDEVRDVGEALRRAQPSMAPLWNAAEAAGRGDLERFAQRAARAPRAIARFASDLLEAGLPPSAALSVVTISYSSSVAGVFEAIARRRPLEVACGEGRPALEGRRLAARLAAAGARVTLYGDAAIARALDGAGAVVVGADAVTSTWFLNKSGTRMLAAAAAHQGLPVYVLAGREKCLAPGCASALTIREEASSEVWPDPPAGVVVRNPYFERIPLDLVAAVVSDIGVLGPGEIAQFCAELADWTIK